MTPNRARVLRRPLIGWLALSDFAGALTAMGSLPAERRIAMFADLRPNDATLSALRKVAFEAAAIAIEPMLLSSKKAAIRLIAARVLADHVHHASARALVERAITVETAKRVRKVLTDSLAPRPRCVRR
jgi:hypothetical protein